MNITFGQVEQYKENHGVKGNAFVGIEHSERSVSQKATGSFLWDKNESVIGNQAYRENGGKKNLLEEASSFDAAGNKDFMVVMSNTMSDEDYAKIAEKGGNPGDYEPGEMVTVVDEIKVKLAQAGIHIAGYTDQIDENAVREVTGSDTYAAAIAHALESKDLPATDKNIKDCYNEIEKATHLPELSDGAKKYILENGLEPTIDTMYKATYAGAKDASAQPGGYFGAGAEGYLAKKGTAEDIKAMEGQIKGLIEKAGLPSNEETLQSAHWLLEKGLPLTEENLIRLDELNHIKFPIGAKEAALAAADAISVGLSAKEANLTIGDGYQDEAKGYLAKAQEINEKTQSITEDDVMQAVARGKSLNLYQLFQMKAEASTGNASVSVEASMSIQATTVGVHSFTSEKPVAQMLKIQIQMSAQANLKLMRQGIHIELEPLDNLLKLFEQEESIFHSTELANISSKAEEIKSMPAATLGISVQQAWMMQGTFTLERVYESGKNLAQTYIKAGETYEALMTAPRADLGDSIKTAFRNVDELLFENGFDVNTDNQRAARILGYNQMEISKENMDAVKEADAMLNRVLHNLTPEKTLEMIREGVNPLEMNLDELNAYLKQGENPAEDMEKYSRYLYNLEKNGEISTEEKEAYIGIYRLLHQIEKGDSAAIGAVVANKQELNLENLLSAVRTRKKGYIDTKIDDAFGLLQDVEKNGASITDQIMNYYQNKAGNLLDDMAGYGDGSDADFTEDAMMYRQMGAVSEEHFAALLSDEIPVTGNHLLAQQALSAGSNLYDQLTKATSNKEKAMEKKLSRILDAMDEGKEAVKEAYEDMGTEAVKTLEADAFAEGGHIDVRSMAHFARQVELISDHAKNENYYVPMQLSEEWTMVHVQIKSGSGEGKVSIDLRGMATATFTVKEERMEGLIGVANEGDVDKYSQIADKCAKEILAKTGKEADITCVYSKTMNVDAFLNTNTEGQKTSNRVLYQVAKAFIHTMEQEVSANESQL